MFRLLELVSAYSHSVLCDLAAMDRWTRDPAPELSNSYGAMLRRLIVAFGDIDSAMVDDGRQRDD